MRQVAYNHTVRNSVPSEVSAHSLYGAWYARCSIFLLPGFTYSNVTYFIQALPTTWSHFSLLWRFPHLNPCLTCSVTYRLALHNVLHLLPVWLLSEMLVFCSSSCEKSHWLCYISLLFFTRPRTVESVQFLLIKVTLSTTGLLRVELKGSHWKKEISMWGDGCVN